VFFCFILFWKALAFLYFFFIFETLVIVFIKIRLDWLIKLGLNENSSEETITKQTIKKLQEHLFLQFGMKRIKIEAKVAENMTLRFSDGDLQNNKVV